MKGYFPKFNESLASAHYLLVITIEAVNERGNTRGGLKNKVYLVDGRILCCIECFTPIDHLTHTYLCVLSFPGIQSQSVRFPFGSICWVRSHLIPGKITIEQPYFLRNAPML
jgi:hypothetical protein